jgi:beta-lactamase class A
MMDSTLHAAIDSVIAASGATTMGVAIKHLESGWELHRNADQPVPLCSVFKIPVLCEAFRQIDEGRFGLDDRWQLTLAEKNLPSGVLVFLQDGLLPTVRDLLTLMIIISDNTATDMVMHRLGKDTATRFMHELGLVELHVPLTVRGIFDDILGEASDPRRAITNLGTFHAEPAARRNGVAYSLGSDNNVGTPRGLNRLLEMIWRGEVVNRAACDQMLHILLQQTLDQRLPRFLPEGTPVAHKTGTLGGIRNDSGIIYCSDNSHVAVTVFATWNASAVAGDPVAEWQQMIAIDSAFGHIGRLAFDAFRA